MPSARAYVAVLLALSAAPAFADRDPQSGAPLPPGPAQDATPINDHASLSGVFYDVHFHTTLQSNPTVAGLVTTGTPLNAENDLGMPADKALGAIEGMVRPRERHRVRVAFLQADRSGSVLLANPVVFGNQTFAPGQQLDSSLNWRMGSVAYTYSFYRSANLEIGAGIAAYVLDMQADLKVLATAQEQVETASGGMPAVPLDLTWCFARHFSLSVRGAYFKANFHSYNGSVSEVHTETQYRWTPNFSTGFGYTTTRMSLTRTSGSNPGYLNAELHGPQAFFRVSF